MPSLYPRFPASSLSARLMMLACAVFFLAASALPGMARGPGNYSLKGKEGNGNSYAGTSTLTQIGEDTWRITWRIGGQTWNGYGIGDGKFIAMNFSGNGQTGVMLLVAADDGGGYEAVWAYTGERKAGGREVWRRN